MRWWGGGSLRRCCNVFFFFLFIDHLQCVSLQCTLKHVYGALYNNKNNNSTLYIVC